MARRISDIRRIESCLDQLCNTIGARPTGSVGNRYAQAFISSVFEENHFNVEIQSFDCIDWIPGNVLLELGDKKVPAAISPYSNPCKVEGEFEIVESVSRLESVNLEDKVAVLTGELTKEPLMPKKFRFWNPESHKHIISLLEKKNPKAIITLSYSEELPLPVIEDGDFNIPSASVAGKHLSSFQSTTKILTLEMHGKRAHSTGGNVIGRLNQHVEEKVVVCAHFDTKPGTPGALDNASGVSSLLLLSRLLKNSKKGIDLVAFNGEDYFSTPGQIAYLDKYSNEFIKTEMVINCDGIGFREGKTGISPMFCPPKLTRHLTKAMDKYPSLTVSAPWYQGDHMIFAEAEIPILAITSEKIFELLDSVIHTPKDRIELIQPEIIYQSTQFIADIVSDNVR